MENRSRGHVAKYNVKWLRRIRLKSDLRSFLYWVILNIPRVLSFSIENSDMKYEEFCLLRRSYISPDLYVEQFVVRHNILVPCPTGFMLFDIAKRGDWIPSLEKKDRPIEFISSSMIQDLWITVLRSTRNYYLLSSFLKESVSLIREYTVNITQF